jgi:nucleotide-binding universal stress UspA family protein
MLIVVGTDGSPTADNAVRWAVAEAAARGAQVEVWHAWQAVDHGTGAPPDELAAERTGRGTLDHALSLVTEPVKGILVRALAASALLDASRDADLLVVGAGSAPRLGSVATYVAAHARCPVVVVPP